MKDFFKSTAFKIVLGTLLIISGIVLYSVSNVDNNVFASALSSAALPFQKSLKWVSDRAFDFSYQFEDKENLKKENESLKAQINELRDMSVDYNNTKRENLRFRKYYEIKKSNESLKFVSASVIGRDSTDFFGDFVIDKGSVDGLSLNDAVLSENGLVGRICRINSHSSRVKTILSPECKIGVVDCVTGDSGIISGVASDASQNLTRMTFIPAQSQMKAGDIVVTSGISGMYPKNLKVGQIKSIEYDSYDSSYYAITEPFENIKEIRDVFVVSSFKGKGAIEILKDSKS